MGVYHIPLLKGSNEGGVYQLPAQGYQHFPFDSPRSAQQRYGIKTFLFPAANLLNELITFLGGNFFRASRIVVGSLGIWELAAWDTFWGEGHGSLLRVPNRVHRIDGIFIKLIYHTNQQNLQPNIPWYTVHESYVVSEKEFFLIHGDIDMLTWFADQADLKWCIFLEMDGKYLGLSGLS